MQARRWLPDQPTRIGRHDWPAEDDNGTHLRLRVGSIVVLDRQAWRLLEINGYTGDSWPKSYEKAWRDHLELWWHANELWRANNQVVKPAPERSEFYKRPVVLVLRNENLPRSTPKHWCAPASHDWQVLPEHYAVCRACGELPPCHHGQYRWDGGPRWPEQNGGIPLIVPEDCCMGCAEPIRPRVRTVRFPGPNLWYPDLEEDTAVFHARTACADQVDCYRMQWQAEYNPRPSTHSTPLTFPDFEHFVPRTRHAPDQVPHAQQTSQSPPAPQLAPMRPAVKERARTADGSGTFHPPFDEYRGEPENGEKPAGQPASASEKAEADRSPSAFSEPTRRMAPSAYGAPTADPAAPARPAVPVSPPVTEAPAPEAAPPSAMGAELALQTVRELDLSQAVRPGFHNAEQAARVIEELTAAVRNIALCLNPPAARERS